MSNYAITFTTINVPIVLQSYFDNLQRYDHLQDTIIIIVGDKKTPNSDVEIICEGLRTKGMQIVYLDVAQQLKLAADSLYANVIGMLSWNSDVRRNIGYLYAADHGADVIISIDDDNYALPEYDFIERHSIVGTVSDYDTVDSKNGWFNVCQLLDFGNMNAPVYPRGFLASKMREDTWDWGEKNTKVVAANSGLWTLSPDVDAATNLVLQPISTGFAYPTGIALGDDTWCPLNSQNTAFAREVLPAFFFIPQGFKYNGNVVDRYGDIWMGLLVERVAKHMGQAVTYGGPLVAHLRNRHNYLKDLVAEVGGMVLNEKLARWIADTEIPSQCDTYATAYIKLMQGITQTASDELPLETSQYFHDLSHWAETWCIACDKVL